MSREVQVAVIGGGIVGCSVLYHLARLGWTDSLLLEKRNLTSGSTWHAAGNVTYFGHYSAITGLYVDSIRSYLDAEAESGQSVGFHAAGSLRLATTARELAAYETLVPMYREMQVPYAIVSPETIADLHPLLNIDGLMGAAHTPTDGHVDASGATQALARAARNRGAVIRTHCPVHDIQPGRHGGWTLHLDDDRVTAHQVVVASSFWAREMLAPLGLNLPLYALEHHEVITGPIPALAGLNFEVPTIRDPAAPANTRQEGQGFLCGVYERQPQPWAVDGIPPGFAEQLLVPDLDRIEPHLLKAMQRIPALGEAGIKTINNGPICYTPDGCPLLGPVESHPGLWLATGFCIGIGTGGGSGRYLAQWMVNGAPEYHLPIVYPSRFSNELTRAEVLDQIVQTYAGGYVMPRAPVCGAGD